MSWSITIKGFKSQEDAECFLLWYSNQGEQNIQPWMEARLEEGLDVRYSHHIGRSQPEVNRSLRSITARLDLEFSND